MRKRFVALGVAAGLTFAGGTVAAAAYAADNGARDMHEQMSESMPGGMGSMMGPGDMASMHTPEMDAMHDQMVEAMPAELREACDAAHDAMVSTGDAESPEAHASHHEEG